MIPYDLLRRRCGLSQAEAAALHGVRLDTVKSWCVGRNQASAGVVDQLRNLHGRIQQAASAEAARIAAAPAGDRIELTYSTDDHAAQSFGWPCVGAHAGLLGEVLARIGDRPVWLVPCASASVAPRPNPPPTAGGRTGAGGGGPA